MKTLKQKKKELKKYNAICKRISVLSDRRAEMWLGSIASVPCTDKTPSGAPDGTKTELFIEKIEKIEADIEKLTCECNLLKNKIEAAIEDLHPLERDVLREMYLSGSETSIDIVAGKLHYSPRQIYRIHKKALQKLCI